MMADDQNSNDVMSDKAVVDGEWKPLDEAAPDLTVCHRPPVWLRLNLFEGRG